MVVLFDSIMANDGILIGFLRIYRCTPFIADTEKQNDIVVLFFCIHGRKGKIAVVNYELFAGSCLKTLSVTF